MPVITALNPQTTTGKSKTLFDAVQTKLGMVPNMMRTMGHAPAVLEGYLSFSGALAGGTLSAKLREQIALTVADANHCEYCLSAHSAIGKMVGLTPNQINASRIADDADPKTKAILKLAYEIVRNRGELSPSAIETVRQAGVSDGELAEIIANVSLNIFTNYFNHIAHTEIDFPKVSFTASAQ
ncbi:MAG: carboxymuconolactone decarboxylase family protein [Blastocatellia bacterium]|nr:carboxymuconolactone decarboxylase family protein [Blastocatellia bacterium]